MRLIFERGDGMRKRSIPVLVRLNEREQQHLACQVKKSGLSQEAFIRTLINGYVPKALPPPDYYTMMRELHAIGNNLNQLAAKAHATGYLDRAIFQREADRLRCAVQHIQQAVTSPDRRIEPDGANLNVYPP